MSAKRGKLIVIVAPSGTGKSTLIKRLKVQFPQLNESVSCTTRKPRVGEEHGVHYFFLDKAEFEAKLAKDEFLEWANVHGNYYGTSKKFVEEKMSQGIDLLFDIDVQGADAFKKHFGDKADIIFIAPPSVEELEKRLRHRATDAEEVIQVRLKNARSEILRKNDYDYCVLNDDLERAYNELRDLFAKILSKA